jgi:hypothetical protein
LTIKAFREKCQAIRAGDDVTQMAFAFAIALTWKAFLSEHTSPTAFAQLPRDEQMTYYRKCLAAAAGLQRDPTTACALSMFCDFLAAVISKDRDFELEAGQFLDSFARIGWPLIK